MKKLLLLLVMMLLPMWAWAYDFEVDGICYSITSIDNLTVEVSTNSNTETETSNYEGDVIIPPSVVYNNITFTVTGIGMAAFCYYEKRPGSETVGGNDKITSVSLPSCIEYISTNSFTGCTSLAKIELPENLTSIGIEAFSCCTNLQEVLLGDKVERLAQGCFSNCTSLTKITIPKRVHEIGIEVFSGCNNLIEVNIPYGVTVLRDEVFRKCSSLKNIVIPSSVNEISYYAFEGCSSLTKIDFPESLVKIGTNAFMNCSNLNEAVLPSSLSSLQVGCFEGCNNLTDVKSKIRNPFDIDDTNFPNLTYMFGKLYVPEGTIDLYKQHKGWNKFATIVKLDMPMYALTYIVDGEVYKSYQIEEGTIVTPEVEPTKEGYTFSGWSEIPEIMPAHDVMVTGSFTKNILGTCATPTISYEGGRLKFRCATDNVTFRYDIKDKDIHDGEGDEVDLSVTYEISVYATHEDYYDSEIATATLCWIDADPNSEGIANDVSQVRAQAVLINTKDRHVYVSGLDDGTRVCIYNVNGMLTESVISKDGKAVINSSLSIGSPAIVKIGNKSVKIVIK